MAAASTILAGTSSAAPAACWPANQKDSGRDAVAVEQPIEDRRRADGVADDARVPGDAAEHGEGDGGGEPAQRGQGPLLGDPGDARHHQRERHGEPALLQREAERERERGDRAGGENGARRIAARARSERLLKVSVASAKAPASRTAAPAKGIERSKPAMR